MTGSVSISGSVTSGSNTVDRHATEPTTRPDARETTVIASPSPSAVVSLSARARQYAAASVTAGNSEGLQMVKDRLFSGSDPKYLTGFMDMQKSGGNQFQYLTKDDISLLSDTYIWVKEQGGDIGYVDALAADLAGYRSDDNGRALRPYVTLKGENVYDFTPEDKKTVAEIQNGDAIASTRLDHGFLNQELNPGYSALGHSVNYGFLQKIITKFSSSSDAGNVKLGNDFNKFIPFNDGKPTSVLTGKHDDPIPPPDIISENGVKYVTATGRAHGITDVDGHHQTDSTRSTPDLTSTKSAKDYLQMLTLRLLGKASGH